MVISVTHAGLIVYYNFVIIVSWKLFLYAIIFSLCIIAFIMQFSGGVTWNKSLLEVMPWPALHSLPSQVPYGDNI